MARLRSPTGCPWDREQDHKSLRWHAVEEVYELLDAIEAELTASEVELSIDVKELNRGRLIGNLERIVLTLVVAGGSYSALGFLIAAKGLVRFEEFEKSREFTEYFLVGSLSSVLVALCAGLLLRHALLALWPELLAFQMQS